MYYNYIGTNACSEYKIIIMNYLYTLFVAIIIIGQVYYNFIKKKLLCMAIVNSIIMLKCTWSSFTDDHGQT